MDPNTQPTFNIKEKGTGKVSTVTVDEARQLGLSDGFILKKLQQSSGIIEQTKFIQEAKQPEPQAPVGSAVERILEQFDRVPDLARGPVAGEISKRIPFVSPEARRFEKTRLALAGTLKELVGETGRLTDRDITRIVALIPSVTETDREAELAKQDLIDFLETRDIKIDTGKEDVKQKEDKKPFLDLAVGQSARRFAQDIGVGIGLKGKAGDDLEKAQQQAIDMSSRAFQKAQDTEDPEQKARLMKVAQEALDVVSEDALGRADLFSADIDKSNAERAFGVASDITTRIAIPGLAKGIVAKGPSTARAAVKKATGLFKEKPAKFTSEILKQGQKNASSGKLIRNKAIETAQKAGKKVDGNVIYRSVKEWGDDAIANATKAEEKPIKELVLKARKLYKGQKINPTTAKKRWDTATKGFQASGKAGDTVKAGFHRAVRDGIRGPLDKVTSGAFEEGTALIRQGIQEDKILSSIAKALEKTEIKGALKSEPSTALKSVKGFGKAVASTGLTVAALRALGIRGGGEN